MGHQRLICVANRLPITVSRDTSGKWGLKKSSGGLVSALSAVENLHMTLVGWPGADVPEEDKGEVTGELRELRFIPVYLKQEEIEMYYNGFSNSVLWPLFHYVTPALNTGSTEAEWEAYVAANTVFAQAVAEILKAHPEEPDTLVWIHDYHLMLMPKLLRQLVPNANIGFFLHTPFPSPELFRMLPYREEILVGLLSCNYIAFQIPDYCSHFLSACSKLTNLQVSTCGVDAVPIGGALVTCGSVPIGIDPAPFIELSTLDIEVSQKVHQLSQQLSQGRKIILGVDRLDYMKGIQQKLQAFGKFLDDHPEWIGNCVLVQVAVPSRGHVREYQRLKKHVHELVGELCGKHSDLLSGPPVLYMDQALDMKELVALYRAADVMLITSIRDGMNLVALEYVATQTENYGVLILSEFAGAMQAMGGGAIRVNPWNIEATSDAIHTALTMDVQERKARHDFCIEYVTTHNAQRWAETVLDNIKVAVTEAEAVKASIPPAAPVAEILESFEKPGRKILILDLASALGVPFAIHPYLTQLSRDMRSILDRLLARDEFLVVLTSANSRFFVDSVFSYIDTRVYPLILVAESGCVFKSLLEPSCEWQSVFPREDSDLGALSVSFLSDEWRRSVRKLIDFFRDRNPGTFMEESQFSFKWFGDGNRRAEKLSSINDADIVIADEYVEVRPRHVCLSQNFGHILTHPDLFSLFHEPATACMIAGSFPYRDDDIYLTVGERLSTLWCHQCQSPRSSPLSIPPPREEQCDFYSISISRAKVSKAAYSSPSCSHIQALLRELAGRVLSRSHGA